MLAAADLRGAKGAFAPLSAYAQQGKIHILSLNPKYFGRFSFRTKITNGITDTNTKFLYLENFGDYVTRYAQLRALHCGDRR